ncbi:DMT family transporter [Sphingopyxis sp.]|uniref:DMT family transporter n=1 Tax=Sphingopyxis sp. TaxID=1908224 RepID=UPI002D769EFE|nr:DMT family transporter [Sphingopyxis sp.]HET6526352.1 DMT family transporter [Sphingopyxis sp.]
MKKQFANENIVETSRYDRNYSNLVLLIAGISLLSVGPLMVRLADIGASGAAFWRLGLAIPMLALVVGMGADRPSRLAKPLLAAIAAAGCLYGTGTLVMNASALSTSLANCALIGNFSSFFVAGIAVVTERRRPGGAVLTALSLSAAGLLFLLGPSVSLSHDTAGGDLLALLAAILFTGYFVVIMRMPGSVKPMTVHAISTTAGFLCIAPFALPGQLVPVTWWPISLLVAAQVLGQGLVVFAMPRVAPVLGGLCILLFPLLNMIIGWGLYDETMGGMQLIGAFMIVAALALLQLRGRGTNADRENEHVL